MPECSHIRLAIISVVMVLLLPGVAGAQSDTEAERDRVQDQKAQVDQDLDVLRASNAEVTAALDELNSAVESQRQAVDATRADLEAAQAAQAEAEEALAAARHDVEVLRVAIQEMAIASYVHPPMQDMVQSLAVADFSDAIIARTYLDARAKRDVNLLNLFRDAEDVAETRAEESQQAAGAAAEAAAAANDALSGLQAEQSRQQQVAATVQVRIDGALAESAALADLDADLSAQIAAEQQALLEKLPPEPVAVPASVGEGVPATPSPGPDTGTVTPPPPPPVSPRPPVDVTAPPLATVHGITVHADIAEDVSNMISAAAADGVTLSGSGYRSTQRQIELRRAHCGTSYYAIWQMPSGQCNPPTAPPGRSLHEQGLAIDFADCSSRFSPCHTWLAQHAASYGLLNYPVEPWHWSTTGG